MAVHAVVGDVELAALEPLDLGNSELLDALLVEAEDFRLLEAVAVCQGSAQVRPCACFSQNATRASSDSSAGFGGGSAGR